MAQAIVVGLDGPGTAASCQDTTFPTAVVSGLVVSTSVAPNTGFLVDVETEDRTIRTVLFIGRHPDDVTGGSETMTEDAWRGELPMIGGTYEITGVATDELPGLIVLSTCHQASEVEVLAAPVSRADDPPMSVNDGIERSSEGGRSWAATMAAIGGVVVTVSVSAVTRRRRTAQRTVPVAGGEGA